MSSRENPIILRQSFVKLWTNNIFLPEANSQKLQFISLFKTKVATECLMYYRYTRIIATRSNKNDADLDEYINTYKYQKNMARRKKRTRKNRLGGKKKAVASFSSRKWQARKPKGDNQRFSLQRRFKKGVLYQQILHDFAEVSVKMLGLLFRIRQPLRRLSFFSDRFAKIFYRLMPSVAKKKYFINTAYHTVLLHYYKAVAPFSQHFGRELQKVRKQVHWHLFRDFRKILHQVPNLPRMRRQFYGLLIEIAGRPRGRSRTYLFRMAEGTVAPQIFRHRVTLGYGEAFAKVGSFGIKTRLAY